MTQADVAQWATELRAIAAEMETAKLEHCRTESYLPRHRRDTVLGYRAQQWQRAVCMLPRRTVLEL
jgi:hypothetical protein